MKTVEDINVTPKWRKSKESIWEEYFEANLQDAPKAKELQMQKKNLFLYMAAAVITLLIALPSFAYLYQKDIIAPRGQHLSTLLPDGSKVELNAESSIHYKPLIWWINREVELKGEAYFEVTKGKYFSVHSLQGKTTVLGTSFNIFAREDKYTVTCLTGKVEVESNHQSLVLTPEMQASIKGDELVKTTVSNTHQAVGWKAGDFSFTDVPLADVLAEIERQYNITIVKPTVEDLSYTGYFSKNKDPKQVLEIVGKPLNITLKIK